MSKSTTEPGTTREQVAMRELGVTEVPHRTKVALVVLFLLTVTSVPALQHVLHGPDAWRIFATVPTERNFHEFERELDDASVVGSWIRPRVQALLVQVGVGNEQAYLGDDGVLFYRPGVDYVTGPPFLDPRRLRARSLAGESWETPPQPDPVVAIVDFRDQLRARGIDLLLVPTTVKPQLAGGAVWQNPSWDAWRRALDAAGVEVFDPAPVLAALDEPFLRTDTHWRPAAMRAVAAALAERIEGRLPARPPLRSTRSSLQVAGSGDIAIMLELHEGPLWPLLETVHIEPVALADGGPWRADPAADVLVLGDSFSNMYSRDEMGWGSHAGFVETLSDLLQRPLDKLAINDGGAHRTRRALRDELARGRDRLAGKRLVIWQFANRELAVGDWQLLELPVVDRVRPVALDSIVVRGRVAQRARAPRPGSVPYRDCLLEVHLTDVRVLDGEFGGREALVRVWGMRDNVWTDAARWSDGSELELELVPWAHVEDEYGGIKPQTLDDDAFMELDLWWGTPR